MVSFSYCVSVLNSILGPMWGPTGVLTYATTEKEAFAIVWAIQNLQTYIYDRDFVVETEKSENQRLLRWSINICIRELMFVMRGA